MGSLCTLQSHATAHCGLWLHTPNAAVRPVEGDIRYNSAAQRKATLLYKMKRLPVAPNSWICDASENRIKGPLLLMTNYTMHGIRLPGRRRKLRVLNTRNC